MKRYNRQSGVTLPEMMTAVAITLIMLASSGMIFSSASKSSGKAMALNDMMRDARVITGQLEKDLSGLRGDLPFAFIFEGYDPTATGIVTERRDRVVFFTNGDFKDIYDVAKLSNTARIFYGQSGDLGLEQNPDSVGISEGRRILSRRVKMMTNDGADLPPNDSINSSRWSNYYNYDLEIKEFAPDSYWKSALHADFQRWLDSGNVCSFLRRPVFSGGNSTYLQKLYMSGDVTDFTVKLWILDTNTGEYRWYPNNDDITILMVGAGALDYGFGLCWNTNLTTSFSSDVTVSGDAITMNPVWAWLSDTSMPRAIKVSFKLYDKNRTHFPEGKLFEYVYKVPNTD